jgi:RTX calcium-binding nonapeptide repeat (4 copies)
VRRALALLTGATLFLFAATGTATPEGTIAIRGAAPGTHLRLSVSGSALTVTGPMESVSEGCNFTRGHGVASCQLEGAGSLEIATGPGDDKIEVLEPLPVSLTAYLGAGSDKLIGNDESDVCYPQGTPRNRCIGNGGNDVCISAPVNTDCVGGPGNDYCRTGLGSDGCWGGPGEDECLMGNGHDGCHGEGGNDRLFGGPDSDQLYGGSGFDFCDGGPGVGRSRECQAGPRH